MKITSSLLWLCLAVLPLDAFASQFAVRFGPPSAGNGGPNPITMTPVDWQFSYVTDADTDFNLSLTGLFVGKRHNIVKGVYVELGGGLGISAIGGGPAVFSSFGFDLPCGWLCLSGEFIQAVGYDSGAFFSPYALRLGVSKWF
jgi:hypothetical protein